MRGRTRRGSAFSLLCCLWLVAAAHAGVRQAQDPIFDHRTAGLLATVQAAGTDLPLSLRTGRDVYLFVTAGAAYTDVRALALPAVPPARLAQALASGAAGTSLATRPVTWSADAYSAAALTAGHSHLFTLHVGNTVPLGALIAGLRRAGFVPHTLLRVPVYATAPGLPPPCRPPSHYAWYDDAQSSPLGLVTVRASLTPADIVLTLFLLLFYSLALAVGQLTAPLFARDARLPTEVRRRRYTAWVRPTLLGAPVLHLLLMGGYLLTPSSLVVADLWFGEAATTVRSPVGILFPLLGPILLGLPTILLLLPVTLRADKKLSLPRPVTASLPMSPEEKAVHQRMARWTFLPHLVALAAFCGGIFLLPRTNPLYPALHPLLTIIPIFGSVVVARLFRKPLAAFTRISHDDDLTWRARQLGMQMGVRCQNVQVEDSSRAAHYASITTQRGGDVLVSRKLLDVMSREEIEFLLAQQIAMMQVRGRLSPLILWRLLPLLLPLAFVVWMLTGRAPLPLFSTMPYVLLLVIASPLLLLVKSKGVSPEVRRAMAADAAALAVTGNAEAAQSALTKLLANTPALAGQAATASAPALALAVRLKALDLPTAGAPWTGRA